MTETTPTLQFLQITEEVIRESTLSKIILSKYRGPETDLQRLTIRTISLRNELSISFLYSYKTRDITKNYTVDEALKIIAGYLHNDFKSAHLFTDHTELTLEISKKGKALLHTRQLDNAATLKSSEHDRAKKRFVDINRPFLMALGVTDQEHKLIPSMSHKWKQINKFIEVFSQAFTGIHAPQDTQLQVVDFGSGKGYLTFAIHDYLRHTLNNDAIVTGVELREELVKLCNNTATSLALTGLSFTCGDVKTHAPENTDIMIALHACDTATDYAIHYGIRTHASIIMCSPCCHKQIRPQMHSPAALKPLLDYGIHKAQEAEMVTDTLRALLLEANGYNTKVFEFISLEHTNKNKMILATKQQKPGNAKDTMAQIATLKDFYGIKEHCLESLLRESSELPLATK